MEFLTLSSFQLKISSTNLHVHPPYGDFKILNNEGGGGRGGETIYTLMGR